MSCNWLSIPLKTFRRKSTTRTYLPGVYVVFEDGEVVWIGSSGCIGRRLSSHFTKFSPRAQVKIKLTGHYKELESKLLCRLRPIDNVNYHSWNRRKYDQKHGRSIRIRNKLLSTVLGENFKNSVDFFKTIRYNGN